MATGTVLERRPIEPEDRPDPAIAARLAAARRTAGLSQKDAADKLGVGVPALSLWEGGKRSVSTRRLMQLADAYGVDPAYILRGVDAGHLRDERAATFCARWSTLAEPERRRLWAVFQALLNTE